MFPAALLQRLPSCAGQALRIELLYALSRRGSKVPLQAPERTGRPGSGV